MMDQRSLLYQQRLMLELNKSIQMCVAAGIDLRVMDIYGSTSTEVALTFPTNIEFDGTNFSFKEKDDIIQTSEE